MYLTAAVVLVGVVAAASLVLVIALARRMSRPGSLAAGGIRPGQGPSAYRLPPGSKPAEFHAVTTTGQTVSMAGLAGARALIGFFASGCQPCHTQLPGFAELAKTIPGGPAQVLAVVSGSPGAAAEFADVLDGVASIVVEDSARTAGPVAHAFFTYSWPSFYLLDPAGTVEVSGPVITMLVAPLMADNRA